MSFVNSQHIAIFNNTIRQVVEDLSLLVDVVTTSVDSQCPNCVYDLVHKCSSGHYNGSGPKPFSRGVCPVCDGRGTITSSETVKIPCTVNWVNMEEDDEMSITSGGKTFPMYVKLKTGREHLATLRDSDHLVVEGYRCRFVNEIPRGLKDSVVVEIYAKREE